jgi:hypothetical protein
MKKFLILQIGTGSLKDKLKKAQKRIMNNINAKYVIEILRLLPEQIKTENHIKKLNV